MPSKLTGLFRTLDWSDFHVVAAAAPPSGHSAKGAEVDARVAHGRIDPVPHSIPLRLMDSVTVSVISERQMSKVFSWVFNRSQETQDELLHHEQGHYNIAALVGRDFFVDIMLLKTKTFDSPQDFNAAVLKVKEKSLDKLEAIQKLYDKEVLPEQSRPEQQKIGNMRGLNQKAWDMFIHIAFTSPRPTGTLAADPNSTPHKVRFIDVLTANGKNV
jgi:hypothetical protein